MRWKLRSERRPDRISPLRTCDLFRTDQDFGDSAGGHPPALWTAKGQE